MSTIRTCILSALCAAAFLVPVAANASSHREAPAISFDPAADNTDLWAWVSSGTHDKLYIVAAYNPLEEPSGDEALFVDATGRPEQILGGIREAFGV